MYQEKQFMHEEMIRRAHQGDTTAFRALVEAYTPGAWRVARILVACRRDDSVGAWDARHGPL